MCPPLQVFVTSHKPRFYTSTPFCSGSVGLRTHLQWTSMAPPFRIMQLTNLQHSMDFLSRVYIAKNGSKRFISHAQSTMDLQTQILLSLIEQVVLMRTYNIKAWSTSNHDFHLDSCMTLPEFSTIFDREQVDTYIQ